MAGRSMLLYVLVAALAWACKPQPPALLIPEEDLVPLLADIHLAEAAIQNTAMAEKDSLALLYYQKIYAIHGVSPEQFDQTMSILRKDPARTERLYNQVLETLALREAEIQ